MDKGNYVQTIVRADLTAYIYKSRLEKLLQQMFGEIIQVNALQHIADRFEFLAPEKVTDDDLMYGWNSSRLSRSNSRLIEDRDETELARQLTSLVSLKVPPPFKGPSAFSRRPTDLEISLIDIDTSTKGPEEPVIIRNEEQFREYIRTRPEHQTRIISICSKNSILPLLITQSAMQILFDRYDIGMEFQDLANSFGRKPGLSDVGHGRMTIHRRRDGAYDIQYLLPYVESYGDVESTKYTDRWVGVFNRFSPERAGQNLWIILHPEQNSEAQQRIESAAKHALDLWNHPSLLHLVILSSYMGNWRFCIQSLGEEVERMTDRVMVSKFTDETSHSKALDWLPKLARLREKLLPFKPKLKVVHQVLGRLKEVDHFVNAQLSPNPDRERTDDMLESYLQRVEGHLQSVETLECRLQETLNLLEVAVDLGNRNSTGQINKRMLQLASHGADDSAAVRVITILTMLYLPPSFVSTFLGMDLFKFDNENTPSGVTISKGFWLFCILCIPLSAGTFLSWKVFWNRHRQKRQQWGLIQGKDIELGSLY
ncbi:hypothetical protein BDW72DRAFT_190244 [Aspergillus terricola var. indicus]